MSIPNGIALDAPLNDDTHTTIWEITETLGHEACLGWTHDPREASIMCACGAVLLA